MKKAIALIEQAKAMTDKEIVKNKAESGDGLVYLIKAAMDLVSAMERINKYQESQ